MFQSTVPVHSGDPDSSEAAVAGFNALAAEATNFVIARRRADGEGRTR